MAGFRGYVQLNTHTTIIPPRGPHLGATGNVSFNFLVSRALTATACTIAACNLGMAAPTPHGAVKKPATLFSLDTVITTLNPLGYVCV